MRQFIIYACALSAWLLILGAGLYIARSFENSASRNEITIGAWGDIFDAELIAQFEKQTGIAVRMTYYASNEELIAKMRATGGQGLDLVVPSDYAVKQLIDLGFLQKIDKTKLTFYHTLYPELLGHRFDPHNDYSLPWQWEVYGLGIRTDVFTIQQARETGWDLIFKDPQGAYTITMVNDPLEMVSLTGNYLYGKQATYSVQEMSEITDLLCKQKQWVRAYVDFRADYFLITKNCPVVVSSSSYILKARKRFANIEFAIPRSGTFVTIENCVLPAGSAKQNAVYALLNFLYRGEHGVLHYDRYGLFPAVIQDESAWNPADYHIFNYARELIPSYQFFKRVTEPFSLINTWAFIKSQ